MRVSTMTVYRLIKAGDLPAIRVGKHFRIRRRDLTTYLEARRVGAAPIGEGRSEPTGHEPAEKKGTPWPAA
jgi:excisionase family DNA binding protein